MQRQVWSAAEGQRPGPDAPSPAGILREEEWLFKDDLFPSISFCKKIHFFSRLGITLFIH